VGRYVVAIEKEGKMKISCPSPQKIELTENCKKMFFVEKCFGPRMQKLGLKSSLFLKI